MSYAQFVTSALALLTIAVASYCAYAVGHYLKPIFGRRDDKAETATPRSSAEPSAGRGISILAAIAVAVVLLGLTAALGLRGFNTFEAGFSDGSSQPDETGADGDPATPSEELLLEKINATRDVEELDPWTADQCLGTIATYLADELSELDRPWSYIPGSQKTRVEDTCTVNTVEALTSNGPRSVDRAVEGWLLPPASARILLNPRLSKVGIAAAITKSGNTFYMVIAAE